MKAMKTTSAERRVIRHSREYYRWLIKRDFKKGDFVGAKGRWFDACASLARAAAGRRK